MSVPLSNVMISKEGCHSKYLNIQGQFDWRLADRKFLGQSGSSKRMYNVNFEHAGRKEGRREGV